MKNTLIAMLTVLALAAVVRAETTNYQHGTVIFTGTVIADGSSVTNVQGDNIASGSVSASQLEDSSVTSSKIASNAVGSAQITAGSVESMHLATGVVTTAKLADASVTSAKLDSGSVGTNKAALAEWNDWGDGRYVNEDGDTISSLNVSGNLSVTGEGSFGSVQGDGSGMTNVTAEALGAYNATNYARLAYVPQMGDLSMGSYTNAP